MAWSRSFAHAGPFAADADHLADQVGRLSADIGKLAHSFGHEAGAFGHHAKHSATELAGDLVQQFSPMARRLGKQARIAGRRIESDPAPAVIALGTFALVVSLVLARR